MKNTIRKNILKLRKNIDKNEYQRYSDLIIQKTCDLLKKFNYNSIAIYYPIKNEVNTLNLIEKQLNNKAVFLPKIIDNEMYFFKISSLKDLKKGAYNIPEPVSNELNDNIDIYVIPGVAFSRDMYRLGYGGGFYDRYFSKNKKTKLIAICFDLQLLDSIPHENHDIKVDYIVTEKQISVSKE